MRQSLFFNKFAGTQACNFIKKETLVQVFSWEFYEILRLPFFHRIPPMAASGQSGSQIITYLNFDELKLPAVFFKLFVYSYR